MKLKIIAEEQYPVFHPAPDSWHDYEVELSEEDLERWRAALKVCYEMDTKILQQIGKEFS